MCLAAGSRTNSASPEKRESHRGHEVAPRIDGRLENQRCQAQKNINTIRLGQRCGHCESSHFFLWLYIISPDEPVSGRSIQTDKLRYDEAYSLIKRSRGNYHLPCQMLYGRQWKPWLQDMCVGQSPPSRLTPQYQFSSSAMLTQYFSKLFYHHFFTQHLLTV